MRCDEIGVNVSRAEFVNFLNGVRPGQFFVVKGYVNEQGEKADHILRFGIKYGNLKDRDVAFLKEVLDGPRVFSVKVVHGVWIPPEKLAPGSDLFNPACEHPVFAKLSYKSVMPNGSSVDVQKEGFVDLLAVDVAETFNNRKGKGRVAVTVSYELASTHPLVTAAIGGEDLQGTLLQGLVNPRESLAEYDKEAQSAYSMEKDGMTRWYLRDVLRVHKTVRVEGNYEFKAALPINAVKEAISRSCLLTGKYRQFILTDGQFESITIEGQAVLVDGVAEEFYFALPEIVKEAVREEAG